MNEHCKRLPRGQLDALFGVQVSDRPTRSAPNYLLNPIGKGYAVYLGFDLSDYGKRRLLPPKHGRDIAEIFRQLFRKAGIEAPVKVLSEDGEPAACVEVWRYRGSGADYIAIMRNAEFNVDALKALGYPSNEAIEKPERVQVTLPRKAPVTGVRTGKEFGVTNRLTVELDPWVPIILELR